MSIIGLQLVERWSLRPAEAVKLELICGFLLVQVTYSTGTNSLLTADVE